MTTMNSFPLDEFNLKLFTLINASDAPLSFVGDVAVFAANYAIYLLPLMPAGLWLWGNPLKRGALLSTFIAAEIALGLNQIVGLIKFHPRPFMVPVDNTLIDHAADSSFPSDHVTFMVAIAIGLWWLAGARLSDVSPRGTDLRI